MPYRLITAPTVEPIDLTYVKSVLRISSDSEDTFLPSFIKSAIERGESSSNRRFITQTWEKTLNCWPCKDRIELAPGLQSVESVKYYLPDGTESILDESIYEVDNVSLVGGIVLAYGCSWPSETLKTSNGIVIRFTCGYGDASDDVPQSTKDHLAAMVGVYRLYPDEPENREKNLKILERTFPERVPCAWNG